MKIAAGTSNLKVNRPVNRLVGDMPKVGIRPTIDGRLGGVRESLEKTTMNMAKNVAKLIESTLRHSNGLPVECVIADSCIGGVAEAAATAEKFRKEGVGVSLTVTPCWCYGSETMDILGSTLGIENTCGALDGRTPAGPLTYGRITTADAEGKIRCYVGEGELTNDQLDTFGNRAVAKVNNLQGLLQ